MAQSQPYLGGYVLLCGWYKRVMCKFKKRQNVSRQTREPPSLQFDSS